MITGILLAVLGTLSGGGPGGAAVIIMAILGVAGGSILAGILFVISVLHTIIKSAREQRQY